MPAVKKTSSNAKCILIRQNKALSIMKLQAGGGEVRLFSAPKRQGIDEVATLLWQWAHPEPIAPKGA